VLNNNTNFAETSALNNTGDNAEIYNDRVTFMDTKRQQQHKAMRKLMASGNSSTSMYWKDDWVDETSSKKSLINNNIKNRSAKINNTANKESFNKTSCDEKFKNREMDNKDSSSSKNDSCLASSISLNGNNTDNAVNDFDNSKIFSPSGSKNNSVKQHNVEAILNNDYKRFQNDNTTKNKMNLNNDIENDVLSRLIINANTNGCSNTFGTLSLSKDMVGNNLNERFEKNNTIVNTMNYINKKPLAVLLS
jgi:hypothetical protein